MRLTIKTSLIGLFGLLALIAAVQGTLGVYQARGLRENVTQIATNWLPSIDVINRINTLTGDYRLSEYRFAIVASDPVEHASAKATIIKQGALLASARKTYVPLISSAEEQALYDQFSEAWSRYEAYGRRVQALAESGDGAGAIALLTSADVVKVYDASGELLDKDVTLNRTGAQTDADAALVNAGRTETTATVCLLVAVLAGLAAMAYSLLGISAPIGRITRAMAVLAEGDTAAAVPYTGRGDEIGGMADAIAVFRDNMIRTRALEAEVETNRAGAEAQRRAAMRDLATRFEGAVGGIVNAVSSAATELQATAQTMTGTAGETAAQSTTVAAAAEQAAANVSMVAAAAEELGSSVQEIGRQVEDSARLAKVAVEEAAQTGQLVQALSGAASRIGDVVGMISTIAGQTNLLALNATIEAARAGEAGRGFAVVASEVKELASQTAKATDEISRQIASIQGSTAQAVTAIDGITHRIREMSTTATTIAAAVEEQGAATQEIVRNVAQASAGTGEVTANISGVAAAADETGAAASQVLASASELSRQAEHLGSEVGRFLETVKAA